MPSSLANEEGIQILDTDETWFFPDIPEDSIMVNMGYFLERWTNWRFRATPHRVVPPAENDRYSFACFVNPSFDTPGNYIPTCVGPDAGRDVVAGCIEARVHEAGEGVAVVFCRGNDPVRGRPEPPVRPSFQEIPHVNHDRIFWNIREEPGLVSVEDLDAFLIGQ